MFENIKPIFIYAKKEKTDIMRICWVKAEIFTE